MHVILNDMPVQLPDEDITIKELISMRNLPVTGTAVAVNDRLVPRTKHDSHKVKEGDVITLISAAYGG